MERLGLFAKISLQKMNVIKHCLDLFDHVSGQKVNLRKSKIFFSFNVSLEERIDICNVAGMEMTNEIGMYFGVPMIHGRINKARFESLLSKVDNHLARWKFNLLSFVGRVTLVKLVLNALPNHLMQALYLPRSVCDEFDKKVWNFV
ncbi:hypothetical protein GH714_040097 [Hevea brasiliensis]|uniref:Reverse transcriptase domain-containing protein n=1 Tax=Hevea brasiliensis TaxID=3981 RepID=A0A6A6KND5_HEVBR|nr:hypothetical protein GH714_040097 [Hevea brasiliensis]